MAEVFSETRIKLGCIRIHWIIPMNSLATFLDEHSIRFERLLPVRIEAAWSYLTEPDLLETWLAQASLELCEGGKVEFTFDPDRAPTYYSVGDSVTGIIDQVSPPQHLTFSWDFHTTRLNKVHQTHVGFELEECEDSKEGTAFILTHTRIPVEERARFAAGWQVHLEILTARLKGEAPAPFDEIYKSVSEAYRSLGFDLAEEKY